MQINVYCVFSDEFSMDKTALVQVMAWYWISIRQTAITQQMTGFRNLVYLTQLLKACLLKDLFIEIISNKHIIKSLI